ncbi:hypothetical protein H6G33_10540 [Calothrix sp. FACHB-1219]|uniref:hypothetical protein n=1 Tax=unclassified Calothrix TaxID=2619626 RepID=UPI00168863E4|nr:MULTISPECIES: hypothetical protein [unclassified Calothrix]MBD2201785.1 hypothetical protein [Calothrix sp. FACHB-168]MBD2217471.1 hypothetical protein [Calothrix sp. FACHB-1219]
MAKKNNDSVDNNVFSEDTNDFGDFLKTLDIDLSTLEDEGSTATSSTYTPFTKVENIRVLVAKWGDSGSFTWSMPGNLEYIEELEGLANPNWIGGFILHAEIKSSLEEKGEDGMNNTSICSVVGFRNPVTGEWLKKLPDFYAITGMYDPKTWDDRTKTPDRTKPAPEIDRIRMVGSRNQFCADCIRSGNSVLKDPSGEIVSECGPYGRLFFYVTEIGKSKKLPPSKPGEEPITQLTIKTVKELLGEEGFILMIKMPHKTAIKGRWDSQIVENRRIGYAMYLNTLKRQFSSLGDYRKDPRFVYTSIAIKPPIEGSKSSKNYLHFEAVDYDNDEAPKVSHNLQKKAIEVWSEVNPNKQKLLLNSIPGIVPVVESRSLPPMKSAVVEDNSSPFA